MADPTTVDGLVGDPNAAGGGAEPLTGNVAAGTFVGTGSTVANNADYVGGMDVGGTAANIVQDPSGFLGQEGNLVANTTTTDANTVGANINNANFAMDVDGLQGTSQTGAVAQAANVTAPTSAQTYTAATTAGQVNQMVNNATAANATFSEQAQVNAPTLDMTGLATGVNTDGSTNAVGQAFNQVQTQDFSRIVDTSTVSGRLLAETLGEGNYTDAKTQVTYWMDTLSKDFVDPSTGQAKIPTWAAGALKGVNRMIAFKGVTGTAAVSAVASATMEALIPLAQEQSRFFQTLTVKNLDSKNTEALNTANILSKMNVADLDARMTSAITNAKNFVTYDMTNLANDQQVEIISLQAKQQAIMEDGKAENVARQFNTSSQNDIDKFYDQLGAQVDQFNTSARNSMAQFNAGEENTMERFNLELENTREQFYNNMQYQIDAANAKWRQTVSLSNTQALNDAAATDVKNIVGLTTEQLNQMWDRTDALLDYAWKESENQKNRRVTIQQAKMQYDAQIAVAQSRKKSFASGIGSMLGAGFGNFAGTEVGASAIAGMFSDMALKTNIELQSTSSNGVDYYTWEWNDQAKRIGADKYPTFGVIAQEVEKIFPEAVQRDANGYLRVNYGKIST